MAATWGRGSLPSEELWVMDGWGVAVIGVAAALAGAVINHWLSARLLKKERDAAPGRR